MSLIQQCAFAFEQLLVYEYHFVLGRKGTLKEFYLSFEKTDFHYLAGLHKLKDITHGQPLYTLLKKEKKNLLSGEISILYDKCASEK